MDNFLRTYNGHLFQDDGIYCSRDFKSFSLKAKNYLKRNLPADCEIINHRCGHYDFSGFVKKGDKHVYYSYGWNRHDRLNTKSESIFGGGAVLVRTAKDSRDFRGGTNNFTSFEGWPGLVKRFLG